MQNLENEYPLNSIVKYRQKRELNVIQKLENNGSNFVETEAKVIGHLPKSLVIRLPSGYRKQVKLESVTLVSSPPVSQFRESPVPFVH